IAGALNAIDTQIWSACRDYPSRWLRDKFWWDWDVPNGKWNTANKDYFVSLKDRARLRVSTPEELETFEQFFDPPYYPSWPGHDDGQTQSREKGIAKARTLFIYTLFYLRHVLLPYLYAQLAAATGDYASAIKRISYLTGYRVAIAEASRAA